MYADLAASQVVSASGKLALLNQAGILNPIDVHLAQTLARLVSENQEDVLVAVALASKALQEGSACVDLAEIPQWIDTQTLADLYPKTQFPWTSLDHWLTQLRFSPLIDSTLGSPPNSKPLRLINHLLYLERYFQEERTVALRLAQRANNSSPEVSNAELNKSFLQLFSDPSSTSNPECQDAALAAVNSWTSIITGGPGTGKTTTVAKILLTLAAQHCVLTGEPIENFSYALAAPTGKAASRLQESVSNVFASLAESNIAIPPMVDAVTVDRLLESLGPKGYRRNQNNPLGEQVIVVDEVSMVALPLMARLLDALLPQTRLILVGDKNQLASVDAGAVLADMINMDQEKYRIGITELTKVFRFKGSIAHLAEAIRAGDYSRAIETISNSSDGAITWVDADPFSTDLSKVDSAFGPILESNKQLYQAGLDGDFVKANKALGIHRLLCARRSGPYGVSQWSDRIFNLLQHEIPGYGISLKNKTHSKWYVGEPFLITKNNKDRGTNNGDTGFIYQDDGQLWAAVFGSGDPIKIPVFLLSDAETMHAMTIHKSQGSQFDHLTLVLPPVGSQMLTRQLFYTAITRAAKTITILATKESIIEAIKTPARRASGLGQVDHTTQQKHFVK